VSVAILTPVAEGAVLVADSMTSHETQAGEEILMPTGPKLRALAGHFGLSLLGQTGAWPRDGGSNFDAFSFATDHWTRHGLELSAESLRVFADAFSDYIRQTRPTPGKFRRWQGPGGDINLIALIADARARLCGQAVFAFLSEPPCLDATVRSANRDNPAALETFACGSFPEDVTRTFFASLRRPVNVMPAADALAAAVRFIEDLALRDRYVGGPIASVLLVP